MNAELAAYLRDQIARAGDGQPLYRRLSDVVELAIVEGVLQDGSAMPSERELEVCLGISRVTVRAALRLLVRAGHLNRRQGARSIVRGRMEKTPALIGFSQEMRSRGKIPATKWLQRETGAATRAEAAALRLEKGASVVRLSRLRLADGLVIAIEDSVLPADLLRHPSKIGESLYDFLALYGLSPKYGFQRIRASMGTPDEAALLGLSDVGPLLVIERTCFLADGRALEHTRTRYKGSTYEFVSQLTTSLEQRS